MRCDKQVIGTNRRALPGQIVADLAIVTVGGRLERKNSQRRENHIYPVNEFPGAGLRGAEAKLGGNDNAGADGILTC